MKKFFSNPPADEARPKSPPHPPCQRHPQRVAPRVRPADEGEIDWFLIYSRTYIKFLRHIKHKNELVYNF